MSLQPRLRRQHKFDRRLENVGKSFSPGAGKSFFKLGVENLFHLGLENFQGLGTRLLAGLLRFFLIVVAVACLLL